MHDHEHPHQHHQDIKNLRIAFFLNLLFTIIEFVGGLLTNSLAILSDALHDLGDSFSLGLAWYFQKISKKGRTTNFTYGFRRFSLLGAIINSIILVSGSVFIISKAIPRLVHVEEADPKGMMILAVLGIIVNGAAVLRLRGGKSQNEKVVSLHLMEDVLGWIAVLIGSIVIYFTEWYIIDPILSLMIALYILVNVIKNLKKSLKILLQAIPEGIEYDQIGERIQNVPGVEQYHDLHIWSLDGDKNILTVHLVLNTTEPEKVILIKQAVKQAMKEMDIVHCTLEIELLDEDCVDNDND
ncbi:MAG: cation transporter [Bacteroidia bacterium]